MTTWAGRFSFRVSSADPDAATPTWVDLSDYLLPSSLEFQFGRQNDLDQVEPTSVSGIQLINNDDRFTYGNTSSPYAAWWGPGRLCQIQETVGGQAMDRFTGYLQIPTEMIVSSGLQQAVSVSAVDRVGRLATAQPFVSTLAEYIRDAGGTSLVVYLPCSEVQGPYLNDPRQDFKLQQDASYIFGSGAPQSQALATYAGTTGVPGDDAVALVYAPALATGSGLGRWAEHSATLPSTLVVDSGKSAALVFWANFQSVPSTAYNSTIARITGPAGSYLDLGVDGPTGTWRASAEDFSGVVGPTTGRSICTGAWRLIALRITESTGVVEFWDNGADPVTNTIGGATQAQFNGIDLFGQSPVAIAHVQVYSGTTATTYTRAMHLAQLAEGFNALERQTTGDRIRTIARYAGIPTAVYADTIDAGSTVMAAAQLANFTPLDAMLAAVRTEQGLLYADGSGRLVFKDRRSLYNI